MKLSDYVASFLAGEGIRHVFAISGGASIHLIHSLADTPGVDFICPQHEQAGAMAADAYSRVTQNLGAAIATSGPGATNMITGICCSYYDSIPVLYITGQVSTFRLKRDSGVRQLGFQETEIVQMVKPVTKYAIRIEDPLHICYELEKAVYLAKSGRPGPVLVDIPDDIQRMDIQVEKLRRFEPPQELKHKDLLQKKVKDCAELLSQAERPVLILGGGVRLAKAEIEARDFVERLGIPILPTWAMMDFLPSSHPLVIGSFGTHGTRYGNFAVQNTDLVLAIGARLDTREAGSPMASFARGAKKIVVDVDSDELGKFKKLGWQTDILIQEDAKDFFEAALCIQRPARDIGAWKEQIETWKAAYPICPDSYYKEEDVNPYVFVKTLSRESQEGDVFMMDTGCALAWMMQGFEFKKNQRVFHDFNNTAMGYALPASIGASFALDKKPVICITGDGSLQMNIQELATVVKHELPLKIFLMNNRGYSMIQQTQDQWLGSRYLASSEQGGIAVPDFLKIAAAYGLKTVSIEKNKELQEGIRETLQTPGAVFCDVKILSSHRVTPQVKFGRPLEDSEPFLPREEFLKNMLVAPQEVSR